jgi:hypothetical protein
MANRGLLLTLTEPPPVMEEEFNAWYDDEHLPERLAIPGFRSARRWVADVKPGEGKYLATYELDSLGVLESPAYLARFRNQTPWSRRCLGKAVVFERWACEQLGNADPHPASKGAVLDFKNQNTSPPGMLQVRRFRATSGESIALYELVEPIPSSATLRAYRLYRP